MVNKSLLLFPQGLPLIQVYQTSSLRQSSIGVYQGVGQASVRAEDDRAPTCDAFVQLVWRSACEYPGQELLHHWLEPSHG